MSLRYFTLFLVIFTSFKGQAQETPRGAAYFFLGAGFQLSRLYDAGHSRQTYTGITTAIRIGHERVGQNSVSRIMLSSTVGSAAPKVKPKPKKQLSGVELSQFQVSYAYYQRATPRFEADGWNAYVGGVFTVNADVNSYSLPSNNLMGFQLTTSLNAGGLVRKSLEGAWTLQYEAFTPLVSGVLRPNYIGMLPFTGGDIKPESFFQQAKIATFNKLFRFYHNIGLEQQINAHRQRRVQYSWDYWSSRTSKPLKRSDTGLTYQSLFKM